MERLRIISRQVLQSAPVSAEDGKVELTQEDVMRMMNILQEFREGQEKLIVDGTIPNMTTFDMLLASKNELGVPLRQEVDEMIKVQLEDGSLKVLDLLPGPWQDAKTLEQQTEFLRAHSVAQMTGTDIFRYADWQMRYGDRGLGSNIFAPKLQVLGTGAAQRRVILPRVILGDPADAERISRTHVRKEGNFESILLGSVIATTDNEAWQQQRRHLAEVFLPLSSLACIMPVSLSRAKLCADRLQQKATRPEGGLQPVDMSDFLLHEAQAQLQLALLGAPESFMEATNAEIRAAFAGNPSKARVGALGDAMKSLMEIARTDKTFALPSDGCPVRGPLSRAVQNAGLSPAADYGNMLLILFAGHDTTGHTMTWLLFEMARHPDIQLEVQQEADAFFASLDGKEPAYQDLGSGHLDLLDRCITETLRMWPAVASGTYRQLQFDDWVKGPGGEDVKLPRGTAIHIVNWSRHRNPDVWGPDVNDFNPRRNFNFQELARVGCPMAAVTPQSERFSPFAHAPRSCLGRNFAQMEMRLIILSLLRRFTFSLAPPHDKLMTAKLGAVPRDGEWHGVNRATMGPMNPEDGTQQSWGWRPAVGMQMNVTPRS
mmetsp:Transcript_117991/g.252000  ORF Transcript_117991/g.252000 Transcript_117991/m.252000 type:complete len:601 (+) Transcript_117991:59-1861(+)